MACLEMGITLPTVPDIFLGAPLIPAVPIPPGPVDLLCCHFEIPDPLINQQIAILNASIRGLGPLLLPASMTINEIIAVAQAALDACQLPDCPIEGAQ